MKAQMKFQKIMCLIMLICGALSAVYSFIFCSGILVGIGGTLLRDGGQVNPRPTFPQAMIYYEDAQPFNNVLLILSIVMILASAILYITACNSRRNYYISNYVAIGIVVAIDVVISVYIMVMTGIILSKLNAEILSKPEVIAAYEAITKGNDTLELKLSILPQVLGFVIYTLVIVACGFLVANLLWKVKLMKGEKQLLAAEPAEATVYEEADTQTEGEVSQ